MSIDYTGDESATEPPASAFGPGVQIIIRIPESGESGDIASITQPLKVLADYINGLQRSAVGSVFGDGSDGDVTIGSLTTLSRDMFYNNLTVNAPLIPVAWHVFVRNTLTISATLGAAIEGTGATTGVSDGTIKGELAGQNGGNNAAGTNGLSATASLGGAGGAGGGDGASHAGGSGGTVTAPAAGLGSPRALIQWGGHVLGISSGSSLWTPISGGGSGGSGGGAASSTGGNSGCGGPVIFIAARHIVMATANQILAQGGAGDNATGTNAGSGAGGGGGALILGYGSLSILDASTMSSTVNCPGGAGGTKVGTGVVGAAGSHGTLIAMPLY